MHIELGGNDYTWTAMVQSLNMIRTCLTFQTVNFPAQKIRPNNCLPIMICFVGFVG